MSAPNGKQSSGSALVVGITEDVRKEIVLEKCITFIRDFLDLDAILPLLIKKSMLTNDQKEAFNDMNNRYTREKKINHLMTILPQKGFQWFENFIAALIESSHGTGHMDIVRALNRELADSDSPPLRGLESECQPSEISGATSELVMSVAAKGQSVSNLQPVHQTEIQQRILLENQVKLLSLTKSLIDGMEKFRSDLIELQKIYVKKIS